MFDSRLRQLRRDRAYRTGPDLFLFERTFADILERISLVRRRFNSALLIGCPDPSWPERIALHVHSVEVVDPGALFAAAAGGRQLTEDESRLGHAEYDLCIAIGTLDTVNDLPLALANIRAALKPAALLVGAISGGDSLHTLRLAMRAADSVLDEASPHVHPRIAPASLAILLRDTGFVDPVVDIDRVTVKYGSFRALVQDLRAMAATSILADRSRISLNRAAFLAAAEKFESAGDSGRTPETFEILHFAAWTAGE